MTMQCRCPDCGHEFEAQAPESGHRLLCGDSTVAADVDRVLGGEKPHLMITDPPYGVEYDPGWRNRVTRRDGKPISTGIARGEVANDDQFVWLVAWELFGGDVAYVWHAGVHAGAVEQSLIDAGYEIRTQIIWNKGRLVIGRGDYHWAHEPCWYAVRKGKTARGEDCPNCGGTGRIVRGIGGA